MPTSHGDASRASDEEPVGNDDGMVTVPTGNAWLELPEAVSSLDKSQEEHRRLNRNIVSTMPRLVARGTPRSH